MTDESRKLERDPTPVLAVLLATTLGPTFAQLQRFSLPADASSSVDLFASSAFRGAMSLLVQVIALCVLTWMLVLKLRRSDTAVIKHTSPVLYGMITVPLLLIAVSTFASLAIYFGLF